MPRPDLICRLGDESRRIVLISGPAGAGKTTLVNAWAESHRGVVRIELSRREDDPAVLMAAIRAQLGRDHSEDGLASSDLGSLLNTIRSAVYSDPEPLRCLVLDGAHDITDPASQQLLRDVVDLSPADLRLVVITRHRCPDWLNRSRGSGATTTIRACDLELTDAEVTDLLGSPAPELSGWAAGIRMYADLGRAGGDEAIRDYLRTEVLRKITTETRELLYAVAVSGPVGPAQALHLTENPSCGRLLARFAATTQFAAVGAGGAWMLHPALAAHLRNELAIEDWPLYLAIKSRHAEWLVGHGALDDAVRVLIELDRHEDAGTAILGRWQATVLAGRADEVMSALEALPTQRVVADARLSMVSAMANLARGDCAQWQRWSDIARVQARAGMLMEPGTTLEAALRASGRLAHALCDEEVAPLARSLELRGAWLAIDEVAIGLQLMWSGRPEEAIPRLGHAAVLSRVSGDQLALVHALAGRALAAALDNPELAVLAADEAIAIADRLEPSCSWVVANAHLALAEVHLASGNPRAATTAAAAALRLLNSLSVEMEPRARRRAYELRERATASGRSTGRSAAPSPGEPASNDLSARERRVLRALCGPLTLREIAAELFVSHNTVKTQVNSIFRKLGVHDRAAAVAAARSRSLVSG